MTSAPRSSSTSPTVRVLALVLLVAAYGLLYPGVTQPILDLTGVIDREKMAHLGKEIIIDNPQTPQMLATMAEVLVETLEISGTEDAYRRERSILGAIRELHESGYALVAFLVGLFSIIIPAIKGLMVLYLGFGPAGPGRDRLQRFNSAISKWSMADVFVVGVFVAFLAANAVEERDGLISFRAELGPGFYFFSGYCLLSILASQLLAPAARPAAANPG